MERPHGPAAAGGATNARGRVGRLVLPLISFGMVACVIVCSGCEPAGQSVDEAGLAPMLIQPKGWTLQRPAGPGVPGGQSNPRAPQVLIEARFLSGTVEDLRQAGWAVDKAYAVESKPPPPAAAEPSAGPAKVRVLTAPRLVVMSGQQAFITVARERSFVTDWEYLPGRAEPLAPVSSAITEGTDLGVSARVEAGQVVLTRVEPFQTRVLESRRCSAAVRVKGIDRWCEWQEPVVLVGAGRLKTPCRIVLKPNQRLVVPLAYRLARCPPATVRMLAKRGAVHVQADAPPAPADGGILAPASSQVVVVLSARQVQPQAPKPADTSTKTR